jgi:hypothetical protein
MNQLKRLLGFVWVILGPTIVFYLLWIALREIEQKPTPDTIIQWAVFFFISIPIGIGLCLFGWFALKGEYNRLPENSKEL